MAVSKLASGLNYLAGYKRGKHESLNHSNFRGFKVGAVVYSNLKSMKQAFGVKNLRDLESEVDRFDVGSVTAEWYNIEEGYSWSAYLWEGAFRVGTSAYRLFCKTVEEVACGRLPALSAPPKTRYIGYMENTVFTPYASVPTKLHLLMVPEYRVALAHYWYTHQPERPYDFLSFYYWLDRCENDGSDY